MEAAQLISEEWDSLSGQYTTEESIFMTQFLGGTYSCDLATNIDSLLFSLEDAKFSTQYLDDSLISKQIDYETSEFVHAKNNLQLKREHDNEMMMVSEPSSEEDCSQNMENPSKRFRSSIEVQ
jgi:hypothetical protein